VSVRTDTSTKHYQKGGESQWGVAEGDTPVRSGIGGLDVSEWDEPEQLNSIHSTPMPSPMSTPSASAASQTPVPRVR
jgi:hypothetical protein